MSATVQHVASVQDVTALAAWMPDDRIDGLLLLTGRIQHVLCYTTHIPHAGRGSYVHIHHAFTGAWLHAARVQPFAARVHGLTLRDPTSPRTLALAYGDRYCQACSLCGHDGICTLHMQVIELAPGPTTRHVAAAPPLAQWVLAAAWLPDGVVLGLSDNTLQLLSLGNNNQVDWDE